MLEQVLESLVKAIEDNTAALLNGRVAPADHPVEDETVHVTQPKTTKEPAAKTAAKAVADKIKEKVKEATEEMIEPPDELTIDQVRARLVPVIKAHTPAIVQTALAALDVAKLSELEPGRYQELLDVVAKETGEEV